MYVASYISKLEKTLGDVLKSVCRNSVPLGPKKMMHDSRFTLQLNGFWKSVILTDKCLNLPQSDLHLIVQGPDGPYKTQYYNCKDEFSERMGFYEPNMEEYCEAVQELEENGPPEDAWANLAPQTEQQEHEDRRVGATVNFPAISIISSKVCKTNIFYGIRP
jgi:hypothetical protein